MRDCHGLHDAVGQRKRQAGTAGGEAGNYPGLWWDAAAAAVGWEGCRHADGVGGRDDYGAGGSAHWAGERSHSVRRADSAGGGDCG